jgi:acyl-CoA synthetase (AMP-forming)/AMP-acid ligase II
LRANCCRYLANPDLGKEHVATIKKKTAEAIDAEGWLHSGDKGTMDERGMLKITGRCVTVLRDEVYPVVRVSVC